MQGKIFCVVHFASKGVYTLVVCALLLFLFIAIPIIELSVLYTVSGMLGGWGPTLVVIVVTGIIGAALAKHQGLQALHAIREATAAGRLPANELMDGLLILIAGVVLLTPGFLTDIFGFLLLLPVFRVLMRKGLIKWFVYKADSGKVTWPADVEDHEPRTPQDRSGETDYIDVESEVVPPDE